MASIRIRPEGRSVSSSPARSLLICLQREGVPIQTLCGGRARCGKCAVRVLAGAESLSSPRPRETERLAEIGAKEGTRLACQTYARADIEIEIVNPGPGSRAGP